MSIHYLQVVRTVNGIPKGTVVAAEDGDNCWKIIDGPHKGKEIQGYDCKAAPLEDVAYGNDCINGNCDV